METLVRESAIAQIKYILLRLLVKRRGLIYYIQQNEMYLVLYPSNFAKRIGLAGRYPMLILFCCYCLWKVEI